MELVESRRRYVGHDLVVIVSQGDVAGQIDEQQVGDLVEAIAAAP